MQENLIKNYVQIESSTKEDLISVNIILELNMDIDKTILVSIKMKFDKSVNISDMINEKVPKFNDSLSNNNKKIYLNPENNEY